MEEPLVTLESATEVWEAKVTSDFTVHIRQWPKSNLSDVRYRFCRCATEAEALEYYEAAKAKAMRRGFYFRFVPPPPPPPPKVKLEDPVVESLLKKPKPSTPEAPPAPKAPPAPLKRKVRI